MALRDLSGEEADIVGQCLWAAVEGPFFPDWEFQTLMGVSREDVRALARKWQSGGCGDEDADTIVNVLNNIVGYPHGEEAAWSSFITVKPNVVSTVLDKILAQSPDLG